MALSDRRRTLNCAVCLQFRLTIAGSGKITEHVYSFNERALVSAWSGGEGGQLPSNCPSNRSPVSHKSDEKCATCGSDARIFHLFSFYHAYRVPIRNTDELRKRHVATWAEFQQSVVDDAVDQWRKIVEACIHAEGGHFEHLL